MKRLIFISSLLLSAALFFSSPAMADKITAIQTSPASPQAGDQVTATLQGIGNCNTLNLDWGDGTGHYFSQPPGHNYPLGGAGWQLPPHPYTNAGTFTIKVVSVKGCQGTGLTKNITVAPKPSGGVIFGGGLVNLCKYIDCGTGQAQPPKIDNFMIGSMFKPGGTIAVLGANFGTKTGQLHMVSTTSGSFKITDTVVPIIEWHAKWIGATIPNLTGVVDQQVKFYAVTAANAKSNDSFAVDFTATREMKELASGDVQVNCSDEADFDSCNDTWYDDGIPFCGAPFVSGGGGTSDGYHWTCVGSSSGTDSFSASVKNGWRFDSISLYDWTPEDLFPDNPNPKFVNMSGFKSDATSESVTINWNNDDASYVLYSVHVSIVGPKGVPHK
jgi:hypothetical protein